MKPLLYLSPGESLPATEILSTVQAVVVDATDDASAKEAFAGMPEEMERACLRLARIGPAENLSEAELGLLFTHHLDGVVLAACRGPADIQKLDVMLKVAEAAAGVTEGRTALLAEYATVPESALSRHSLAGISPRLVALIFDASALAKACGLERVTDSGDVPVAIRAARAAAILRAHEASIAAYEMLPADALDQWTVRRLWANSRENGFSTVAVRTPRQIPLLAESSDP